jgi:hypothetical protein
LRELLTKMTAWELKKRLSLDESINILRDNFVQEIEEFERKFE